MNKITMTNMKVRLKAIFFDFDGTLAHSEDAVHDTVNEVLGHFGYPPRTREQTTLSIGGTALQAYIDASGDMEKASYMRAHHIKTQFKHMHKCVLFPGVLDTLHKLTPYQKAIITSANRPKMEELLHTMQLDTVVDYLITSDDVAYPKPHVEPFEKAMKYFGVQPNECLMVGDTEADIAGARNAGIRSVGVTYSSIGKDIKKSEPTFTIDHFSELLALLK
jgi:HAD superfamily hydrolase (TIGR01509 family)